MKYFFLTALQCQLRMDELRPFIRKVVRTHPQGSFTEEGIVAKLYTGEWSCWVAAEDEESEIKCVMTTMGFTDMLGRLNVKIIFIGGDEREKWWHLFEDWVTMARQNGVKRVEIVGRKGLVRALKNFNFNHEYVCMVMDLEPDKPEVQPNVLQIGRA